MKIPLKGVSERYEDERVLSAGFLTKMGRGRGSSEMVSSET
jgi:hypothetical protein